MADATKKLVLPLHVVAAIEAYLATNWSDGRDPSKLGALNAAAYIGEQVADVYQREKARHG